MDYSLPGSSVHEILQARILVWVAIFRFYQWMLGQGRKDYREIHLIRSSKQHQWYCSYTFWSSDTKGS